MEDVMLHYAIVFFIIALIAAFFGFFGTAAWIAKLLFVGFLVLAIVSFVMGRRPAAI